MAGRAGPQLTQLLGRPSPQVYTSVLRRSLHGASARVLLYLARAYYDADRLDDARATLLRALHLAPADHQLHFNIALTMQARPPSTRAPGSR